MAGVGRDVQQLVERTVEGLGYELVDVERGGNGLLRVTLDAVEPGASIRIEDCERVSHQLTHLFAVENVDYERLEVSSPGLDRPLRKPGDYVRFMGAQVELRLREARDGRRTLRGRLTAFDGASGAERLRLELADDPPATRTGGRPAKRGGAGAQKRAAAPVQVQVAEVALADVEKARLVPELDFRSGR